MILQLKNAPQPKKIFGCGVLFLFVKSTREGRKIFKNNTCVLAKYFILMYNLFIIST